MLPSLNIRRVLTAFLLPRHETVNPLQREPIVWQLPRSCLLMSLKRLRHCSHSGTATSPFTQTAQMNHRRELCSGILFLAREQAVLKLLPIMGVQRERTQIA